MDSPGTNQFIQPLGAPVSRNYNAGSADLSNPQTTQYARNTNNPKFGGNSFDLGVQRDSIKPYHVKNFNFNSGFGGTLTLGGTANGNGLMLVKDSSGGTQVRVDNNGINVYNGSITIQNSAGTTILDPTGLVSLANFASNQITDNTQRTTTGTTLTDVPGAAMPQFTLARQSRVLVSFWAFGFNNRFINDGSAIYLQMTDVNSPNLMGADFYGNWYLNTIDFAGSSYTMTITHQELFLQYIFSLPAGAHNLKLQFNAEGSGTAKLDFYNFSYIILGS